MPYVASKWETMVPGWVMWANFIGVVVVVTVDAAVVRSETCAPESTPPAPGFCGGERNFSFLQGGEIIPRVGPRSVCVQFYFMVLNFLLPEHVSLEHFLNKKIGLSNRR